MAEWSSVKVDELIDLYEERPCLHNTTIKDYHNRDKRSTVMEEIANALWQVCQYCQ